MDVMSESDPSMMEEYLQIYIRADKHACILACIHAYTYIHTYVQTNKHTYIHARMHAYIHTFFLTASTVVVVVSLRSLMTNNLFVEVRA